MADSVSNNEVVRAVKEHHERVEKKVDHALRYVASLPATTAIAVVYTVVAVYVGAKLF